MLEAQNNSHSNQETAIIDESVAETLPLMNAQLQVHDEAIAENEAMITNIGNKLDELQALEETVDNLPDSNERIHNRVRDALHRDNMAATSETITTKVASLEQQLAAQAAAFEKRIAHLDFAHELAETNGKMVNMDL
ncbi:hypothetical protein ACHAPU_001309 [Fusarium lateritium]